jgi:NAD+ kinase
LQSLGISAAHGLLYDTTLLQRLKEGEFDLLVALGGDGTVLRAGHMCAPQDVPILGINLGRFGFLTEVRQDQWKEMLPRLCSGDYWLEHRMMLHAEQWRAGELLGNWDVLNEIVVSRGHIVRPVHLAAYVDQRYLTTYVADALIASTATGSATRWQPAADLRQSCARLFVPVAPHLSIDGRSSYPEGSSLSW